MTSSEEHKQRFKQIAQNIKQEPEMRKMRDDISEGISTAGELSADAYEVMNSILDESFDSATLSANFQTKLDEKIDDLQPEWTTFQRDTTAQLAQTASKVEVEVERQRINSFVSLPPGSTTGNAELMDIRIGLDGTVYDTAGEAVRNVLSPFMTTENEEWNV